MERHRTETSSIHNVRRNAFLRVDSEKKWKMNFLLSDNEFV